MIFSKAMRTQKPFDGLQCSMNSGPKDTWTMQTYGKEIQFLIAAKILAQNHTTAAGRYPPPCTRQRRISDAAKPLHGPTV